MKKLLRKAAELKGILPSSFYLQNVKRTGTSPFAGGGFSDVWMGEMDETQVVLKALRFFEAVDDPENKRQVCKLNMISD